MRQFTVFLFLMVLCRPCAASAGCIDVVLESESETFTNQLADQLQNESEIQLQNDSASTDGGCAIVHVKMVEDVAIISTQRSDAKSVLIDLSAITPEHWARTVALACATMNVENAPAANIQNPPAPEAPAAPDTPDDANTNNIAAPEKPKSQMATAKKDSGAGAGFPLSVRYGVEAAAGLRWITSYKKDGAGPLITLGILRRFSWGTPTLSLVFSRHTASTRLNEDGAQLIAGGAEGTLWRIFPMTSHINLWMGAAAELLIAYAKGNDDSYAYSHSDTAAVISAFGRAKGEVVLNPRLRLCATFSMGWTLRPLEIQVADQPVLGMEKLLLGATIGIILGW